MPRMRAQAAYISQPTQMPLIAASEASVVTISVSTQPAVVNPSDEQHGRRGHEDRADDVREARRARVLDATLAEARLEHLELEDAGQAVRCDRTSAR